MVGMVCWSYLCEGRTVDFIGCDGLLELTVRGQGGGCNCVRGERLT